jgi:hypothetical protein
MAFESKMESWTQCSVQKDKIDLFHSNILLKNRDCSSSRERERETFECLLFVLMIRNRHVLFLLQAKSPMSLDNVGIPWGGGVVRMDGAMHNVSPVHSNRVGQLACCGVSEKKEKGEKIVTINLFKEKSIL